MEKQIIRCRIDVSKVDKKRLHKGEKGIYLDCTLIESKNQYSDFVIIEDITAEERKSGMKGTILGNAKNAERREQQISAEEIPF
jgi:hypothetical protein